MDLLGREVEPVLDGAEDLGGASLGQVPAVDTASAAQLVRVARWPLRDGEQPRSESTMRRGRLDSAAVRSRQAATSCATPRLRRDMLRMSPSFHQASWERGGRAVAEHLVALAQGPLEPAEGTQSVGQDGSQLEQVGHVAHGVGELAVRHRAFQPVREPVRLGEADAQRLVDEAGQRGR